MTTRINYRQDCLWTRNLPNQGNVSRAFKCHSHTLAPIGDSEMSFAASVPESKAGVLVTRGVLNGSGWRRMTSSSGLQLPAPFKQSTSARIASSLITAGTPLKILAYIKTSLPA